MIRNLPTLVVGVVVIALGVLAILSGYLTLDATRLAFWIPVAVVTLGVSGLLAGRKRP